MTVTHACVRKVSSVLSATPLDTTTPSFASLGLPEALVTALSRRGVVAPFPIQAATMPDALAGRDVLGRGATGSGKTLAFGLPILARLAGRQARPLRPLAMILVPTRELAMQVHDALEPLGRPLGVRLRLVVGGMSFPKQTDGLRRGAEIVVATPGRLTDHVKQGTCDLSDVDIAVLDEADHMADMGFLPQVSWLLDRVAPGGQRLLFSATLDRDVDKLVRKYLSEPVTHSLAPSTAAVSTMEHHLLRVSHEQKFDVTAEIAGRDGRTIMFVRTKHGADRLVKQLGRVGVVAGSLHGGKTQGARTRTLNQFREGQVPVLVATDVAARGVHVDDISLVVHVDPPADPKSYLHRAGRTARAGESGVVVTLVAPHQEREVNVLAKQAGITPARRQVSPGDRALIELTGARRPSGTPVVLPEPKPARPASRPRRAREGGPVESRPSRHGRSAGHRSDGGHPRTGGHRPEGGHPRSGGGHGRPRRAPAS
jgi:superfamily II DNA/RNA helicase